MASLFLRLSLSSKRRNSRYSRSRFPRRARTSAKRLWEIPSYGILLISTLQAPSKTSVAVSIGHAHVSLTSAWTGRFRPHGCPAVTRRPCWLLSSPNHFAGAASSLNIIKRPPTTQSLGGYAIARRQISSIYPSQFTPSKTPVPLRSIVSQTCLKYSRRARRNCSSSVFEESQFNTSVLNLPTWSLCTSNRRANFRCSIRRSAVS